MEGRWADGMLDWLKRHHGIDCQLAAAQVIYQAYAEQRLLAISNAVAKAVRARAARAKGRHGLESGSNRLEHIADDARESVTKIEKEAIRSFYQLLTRDQQALLQRELGVQYIP